MKNTIIKIFLVIIITILSILLYGTFVEPKLIKTNEYKITTDINNNFDGFKIVQISDIHYGTTIDVDMLNKIAKEINLLKADIIVFTGDLFDLNIEITDDDEKVLINFFKSINANIDKYAIKGDHDLSERWENIFSKSDFVDLNDTYNLIYKNNNIPIIISGISSNSNANAVYDKIAKINEYIENTSIKPCYSILLMHEPDYIDNINLNNYDLVLAGHSLGGIYIPIIGTINLPEGANKYYRNYYNINNTDIYVSNGLGTNKYKFRFMNKPSINFYRIIKGNTD